MYIIRCRTNRIAERRLGDESLQYDCYYIATKSKEKIKNWQKSTTNSYTFGKFEHRACSRISQLLPTYVAQVLFHGNFF